MIKFNPINDRIVDEILKGKQEINYDKKICKDDENLKEVLTKYWKVMKIYN